ncbi:hypothetical protein R1sor_004255 [Riccia sorocarpa]|uniref:Uncharacterized protein n=1 Tax=Riccia sorocarpa TaxID=122646 RepID=A0ABD3H4A0_9MARC
MKIRRMKIMKNFNEEASEEPSDEINEEGRREEQFPCEGTKERRNEVNEDIISQRRNEELNVKNFGEECIRRSKTSRRAFKEDILRPFGNFFKTILQNEDEDEETNEDEETLQMKKMKNTSLKNSTMKKMKKTFFFKPSRKKKPLKMKNHSEEEDYFNEGRR